MIKEVKIELEVVVEVANAEDIDDLERYITDNIDFQTLSPDLLVKEIRTFVIED